VITDITCLRNLAEASHPTYHVDGHLAKEFGVLIVQQIEGQVAKVYGVLIGLLRDFTLLAIE